MEFNGKGNAKTSHKNLFREGVEQDWDAYRAINGNNLGDSIRALIDQEIKSSKSKIQKMTFKQEHDLPDNGQKQRRELRFTPSEDQAILERAEAEGCSPQRWLINTIRANLTHEPQFAMETIQALWESSGQLRAIGRNLNQIAKRLNESQTATLTVDQIKKLTTQINKHTERVSEVIAASVDRWVIK